MNEQELREKYVAGLVITQSPIDTRTLKASLVLPEVVLPIKTNNVELELPVRDQGNLPICAGCAGAGDQEQMDVRDIGITWWLSPMFIYNNRENTSQDGMDMLDLMKIRQKKGVCKESLYPMGSTEEPSSEALVDALNHRIGPYAQVDTIDALKQILASGRTAPIAVPVYNFTERMWYKRPGDVFEGGHAMRVIDYNDETQKILIKNSWGSTFGNNGYIEMSYDDLALAWELWAAVDMPSLKPNPEPIDPDPKPKKKWFWGCGVYLLVFAAFAAACIAFLIKYNKN